MKIAVALGVLPLACVACSHPGEMRVFVRDPHAVWVEAPSSSGPRVVLPEGRTFAQVSVPVDNEPFASVPATATVFREANGGITIDYRACPVSPYAPLHPSGELTVVPDHEAPRVRVISSDGPNLRMAYHCHVSGSRTALDLTLVTPWTNVREIDEYER
jgi:hypothetical protein